LSLSVASAGKPGPAKARARTHAAPAEVKFGALRDFLGFNLRLAQDASFRAFARHAGQKGIRPGRFAAMMVLRDNPGISQSALGRAIARDKSSITPVLQDLQRRGLVKRHPSARDRRSVTLTLTAAGQAALDDLIVHARAHDRKLDRIVAGAKPEFLATLRKIVAELR